MTAKYYAVFQEDIPNTTKQQVDLVQDICKPVWQHREGSVWKQNMAVEDWIIYVDYLPNVYLLLQCCNT